MLNIKGGVVLNLREWDHLTWMYVNRCNVPIQKTDWPYKQDIIFKMLSFLSDTHHALTLTISVHSLFDSGFRIWCFATNIQGPSPAPNHWFCSSSSCKFMNECCWMNDCYISNAAHICKMISTYWIHTYSTHKLDDTHDQSVYVVINLIFSDWI